MVLDAWLLLVAHRLSLGIHLYAHLPRSGGGGGGVGTLQTVVLDAHPLLHQR